MSISRSDGQPVRNADGTLRTELTTMTDAGGKYSFGGLEVLSAGTHYVVSVTAPSGYVATKDGVGARDLDSSAQVGKAESTDLTIDGASDLTLDFGFYVEAPGIDVEKYDGAWDGVKFTDGVADLNDGQPAVLPVGDRDSADQALVLADNATQQVRFTVTNTGSDKLNNVVVSDSTTVGPALSDVKCVVDGREYAAVDGVVRVDPVWVFEPAASFDCTGVLPALGADRVHADSVKVEAVTVASGKPVADSDGWHAKAAPKVSVGDYVWFDANGDGVQDGSDVPLADVTLTLSGPDGRPVTDVYGNRVDPVRTDGDGRYLFENLPVLQPGESYTVTVSAPKGFESAEAGVGGRDVDSSTGFAVSGDLTTDGASDLSLDFGFVKIVRGALPKTGAGAAVLFGLAVLVPLAGGVLTAARRHTE